MTYRPPKLDEIKWVDVTNCSGKEIRVHLGRCSCTPSTLVHPNNYGLPSVLNEFGQCLYYVADLASEAELERDHPEYWNGNWPYVVEQLIAEGVLK